jgi:hypothetical protein
LLDQLLCQRRDRWLRVLDIGLASGKSKVLVNSGTGRSEFQSVLAYFLPTLDRIYGEQRQSCNLQAQTRMS